MEDIPEELKPEENRSPESGIEQDVEKYSQRMQEIQDEVNEVIQGQNDVVEQVLIALMCDGNILLEGVPGLGKSLLVETFSKTVSDTDFNRIQFVPDMLPSDILGQRVYSQKKGEFNVNKGPVFSNFLLADEINRAPPKTQAAMMEVMQEKKVSIAKEEYELDRPFLVLATQNPLEQKGTYPLPEAIIDRFFMKINLDYPEPDNEAEILKNNSIRDRDLKEGINPEISREEIIEVQELVRDIYISDEVYLYIVSLVNALRGNIDKKIEMMKYVEAGPSPRASIWLTLGASAKALMDNRTFVKPSDVKSIAPPVLRHRINLNYEGEIKDIDSNDVVESVLNFVESV
ncbi:MAG: MoxR-like ATPase [Candidatus Nanohaloarchaea archaeon]